MLRILRINNLALIDELTLEFSPGLTIITGETGAGKSIIVQAISVLLGESVHAETVKTGKRMAVVEGEFSETSFLSNLSEFADMQLESESDNELILRREISSKGRSRYLVNEQVVLKSQFQWLGNTLLDVNSQHSHQLLLNSKHHLKLLDDTLPDKKLLKNLKESFICWVDLNSRYRALRRQVEESERRKQLLEYQMAEIDDARLVPGEKVELINERERLRYAEEIMNSLHMASSMLDEESTGIMDTVAQVAALIQKAADKDTRLESLAESAESMSVLAGDISQELQTAVDAVENSPDRLEEVSERVHQLQQLEGKFQNDINGILQYRKAIETELADYESGRNTLEDLAKQWLECAEIYRKLDSKVSMLRKKHSGKICKKIENRLHHLGMTHARFQVDLTATSTEFSEVPGYIPEGFTEFGSDQAEFLLSANPGVPLKSLSNIASGGELSRVMLALKQHLGVSYPMTTIVFDEVDTGIGGDVANAVALQVKDLSHSKQVLCVTHLPQIAVAGDTHFLVEKSSDKKETHMKIGSLDRPKRIREIARMLSGKSDDLSALAHATNMLDID